MWHWIGLGVLVSACWHSNPEPPIIGGTTVATIAAADVRIPVDAPFDAPLDAPVNAPVDAPPPIQVPPGVVLTRILKVETPSGHTVVTIGAGSRQGLRRTSTVEFLDGTGAPLASGACAILRLERSFTICETRLAHVPVDAMVRVTL